MILNLRILNIFLEKTKIQHILTFIFVFLLNIFPLKSQDIHFSQFKTNLINYNPAFSGYEKCAILSLHYKKEQALLNSGFNTFQTSYNQYFSALHGGIGINIAKEQLGGNTFTSTSANTMYSSHFKINRKTKLALAIETSYYQNSFDASNLVFSNMIDELNGIMFPSAENFANKNVKFVDFSTGILFYQKKKFIGISASHLRQFMLSGEQYFLPIKYNIQAGYRLSFDPLDLRKEQYAIMPIIIYGQQQKHHFLKSGFYFIKKNCSFGFWLEQSFYPYFTNNVAIITFSVKLKKLQITYSYDIPTTHLFKSSFANSEISLQFNFNCKEKRNGNTINCPAYEL